MPRGVRKKFTSTEHRFWSKVEKTDGCWLWTAGRQARNTKHSYGVFGVTVGFKKVKQYLAHRYSYELANGLLPDGRSVVCHHCDNPICVRPDHLFLGTDADNVADMHRKGRWIKPQTDLFRRSGENASRVKLTTQQVLAIKGEFAATNCKHRVLAEKYGVSKSAISRIVTGRRWKGYLDRLGE